jgi:hypothetical protein
LVSLLAWVSVSSWPWLRLAIVSLIDAEEAVVLLADGGERAHVPGEPLAGPSHVAA